MAQVVVNAVYAVTGVAQVVVNAVYGVTGVASVVVNAVYGVMAQVVVNAVYGVLGEQQRRLPPRLNVRLRRANQRHESQRRGARSLLRFRHRSLR